MASLGLTGHEHSSIRGRAKGVAQGFAQGKTVQVIVRTEDGQERDLTATVRLDTPMELEYFRHGGILQYVLRQLA